MNRKEKAIICLEPVFKQMIWGGERLGTDWPYKIPGPGTGECWAVSAHPNGACIVREGIYAGKSLSRLWEEESALFGNAGNPKLDRFPLLTKIIDAKSDLSIQVHPDDAYAKAHENGSLGKTECWYILECGENASLVIGHNAKDYYKVWKIDVADGFSFSQEWPFLIMSVIAGDGEINGQTIRKGDHFILSCRYGEAVLKGRMEIIAASI